MDTDQLKVEDSQMMVDKTGVGPGGGTDPPVKSDAPPNTGSRESQTSQQSELRLTVPIITKSLKEDVRVSASERSQRTRANQKWMKLRTTVQLSGAISSTIQKPKPQLKREDSFLKRFSTRQIPETQETLDTGDDADDGSSSQGEPEGLRRLRRRKRRHRKKQPISVVNPDENFYYYWLFLVSICVLYNLWTLIVRQSFPEFQKLAATFWFLCDNLTDLIFILDIVVQFRTGYLEQGLMVYDSKKLARHYVKSRSFVLDLVALIPLQLLQLKIGTSPILRFPRFVKVYRVYDYYYMVESRTVYPNLWRVVNLIHILLILAHWFGCFYYLLSEAEGFKGDWVYPERPGEYSTLTRKYLGSLYWSTLTLTTIGDLPTPETDAEFVFTIVSYLIGVFIFATIVGQVGNVITNRNANRLEFERLLDGAKTYMRHHKVPSGMKRRVLRWYDYSWSRGRIQGGGDINTALGLLPDKLKTELALHVNLSVLKKVTIFQECQPEFLHDLVLKMKAFIFTPGDLICRKGEVAREMFIIADGILEVISETGHVLTTMMAGDFFGEIGILNLDGLNKRTADVRSVGYSELFSLSREDVLAAMKDYPEAQEILQTLGRKRLMEARNVTRAVIEQRKQAELNAMENAATTNEHRSKNKIVERIYSDVKGLKSVLRKSRRGTKSDDSLELQPLTSISGKTENQFLVSSKGTLCRMQKVLSEDTSQDEDFGVTAHERRISAGFPLLNKLKTLTDKHHEHHHPSQPLQQDDQVDQMEQKHEEPEPLGAGLPLLQRIKLLKQKEDEKLASSAVKSNSASTVRTQHSTCVSQPSFSQPINKKPKVAKKEVVFAEDLLTKQQDTEKSSDYKTAVISEKISKHEKKAEFVKPWCLLRKATMTQSCALQAKHGRTIKYEQFRHQCGSDTRRPEDEVNGLSREKNISAHRSLTRLCGSSTKSGQPTLSSPNLVVDNTLINFSVYENTSKPAVIVGETEYEDNVDNVNRSNSNCSTNTNPSSPNNDSNNNTSSSSSEIAKDGDKHKSLPYFTATSVPSLAVSCPTSDDSLPVLSSTCSRVSYESGGVQRCKKYKSIDDLSPEYSGLPFVKKLKILNERQKLAELEERVFVRSCSLDSSKGIVTSETRGDGNHLLTNLTRSLSEATAMEVVFQTSKAQNISRLRENIISLPSTFIDSELPSPEGCETLERRKLKSILRKISSGNCKISDLLRKTQQTGADNVCNEVELIRRLMNAQTVEGYVARHSTLEKSVTCNTMRSPPSASHATKNKDSTAFTYDDINSLLPIPSISSISETDVKDSNFTAEKDSSHSPSNNPDLIPIVDVLEDSIVPNVQLPAFVSEHLAASNSTSDSYTQFTYSPYDHDTLQGMQSIYKSQVKEIELEVRKRDMLIEVLQSRIQELQRHHEYCFHEDNKSDEIDCDIPEQPFSRDDSVDTVLLSPTRSTSYLNKEYQSHIEHAFHLQQPKIMLQNRRSWEDRSEEETLELRDLPSSITPRSVWKDNISIDIASEDTSTSASETDELFMNLKDDLHLMKHDQDWEVRMLARELEKREHKESQQNNKFKETCTPSDTIIPKMQLLNVRSLEERCTFNAPTPSQRSISSDNIYSPPTMSYSYIKPTSVRSTTIVTTSVSPDVVPVSIVTTCASVTTPSSGT